MPQGEGVDEVYERVAEKLGVYGFHKKGDDIEYLMELFSPEEAKVVSYLAVLLPRKTPEEVAEESSLSLDRVKSALQGAAKKGAVAFFKKEGSYCLLWPGPGFLELSGMFPSKAGDEDKVRRLGRIMERGFFEGSMGCEIGASDSPWARVVPIEKSLDARSEILPFEKVSGFIEDAERVFLGHCFCRTMWRHCNNPTETCIFLDFGLDIGFDFLVDEGVLRKIDKGKAYEILENCERAGLVHTAMNSQKGSLFLCNCCTCCCAVLRGLTELHNPRAFVKSNFVPSIDKEKCNKCEACVKICPMGALFYHRGHTPDMSDDEIKRFEERCIGCGLCATHCPKEAITLVKVRTDIPPQDVVSTLMEYQAKRIH